MIDIDIRLEPDGIKRLADKLLKLRVGLEVQAKTALKQVGEQYYEIVVSRMGEYRGGEMVFVDTYWKELSPSGWKRNASRVWSRKSGKRRGR